MGRAEWTLCAHSGFLAAADSRPDADDFQPLCIGQRRQNGGKTLGQHAFARAGRSGQQYIMSAGCGDFKCTLDRVLPHHVGKIERLFRWLRRLRGFTRWERSAAGQMVEQRV